MGLTRITSDGITEAAIVNADINASAAIAGTKISPDFGSQAITTTGTLACGDITSSDGNGNLTLKDNNHTGSNCEHLINFTASDDTSLMNIGTPFGSNALFFKYGSTELVKIDANAQVDFAGNVDCNAGLDVTGGGLTVNTGTTNTCATFTSTDAGAVINLTDNSARSSIEQNGTDLKIISDTDASDADSTIKFQVDASTKMTLDSSGRVLIGTSSSRNVGGSTTNSKLQIEGTSTNTSSMSLVNNENSTAAPFVFFGKTRGNSAGESGIVQNGDTLGGLSFIGADSVDTNNRTAEITAVVNGSPANNTIPTDLTFSTSTQHAGQLAERMRVKSDGSVGIGHNDPGQLLSLKVGSGQQCQQSLTSATDQSCAIYFGDTDSVNRSVIVHDNANDSLAFNTAATERMRIDSAGNVGINESSPSSELVVKANDSNESAIQILAGGNGKESQLLFAAPDDADVGSIRYDHNGDAMKFTVATGERMRIDSSGNVLIGTTGVGNTGSYFQHDNNTRKTLNVCSSSTAAQNQIIFRNSNGRVGVIQTNGTSTSYNTSFSDIASKKNFENWNENVLSLFKNINPQKFNFKVEDDSAIKSKGFIAQEMVDKFPEAYQKEEGDLYQFNPSGMVVYLMKALQEAVARIEALEAG